MFVTESILCMVFPMNGYTFLIYVVLFTKFDCQRLMHKFKQIYVGHLFPTRAERAQRSISVSVLQFAFTWTTAKLYTVFQSKVTVRVKQLMWRI